MQLAQLQDEARVIMRGIDVVRGKYQGKVSKDWSDADLTEFENLNNDLDRVEGLIQQVEKSDRISASLGQATENIVHGGGKAAPDNEKVLRAAWGHYLQNNDPSLVLRANQADNPGSGGFLIAPIFIANELIAAIKNTVYLRELATVYTLTTAESLGVPSLESDVDDASWTTEIATVPETADFGFGRRELKPNPLRKLVRVSRTLMRKAPNADAIAMDRLAYKFGVSMEKGYLLGTGANQPLGVFTASASGVPTSQDTTCSSATAFTADEIIDLKHSLKAAYWPKAAFILHRDTVKRVRKLKDQNSNYIWATGLGPAGGFQGNPATILESPYLISEYAPNTFTTGQYVMAYGDFSRYYIADSQQFSVQVLLELYAATRQIGFVGELETDGQPAIGEAFARLKLG
jgi:HK97 family phage major capsid protein